METRTTERICDALIKAVVKAKTIVLCAHVNPDGDTLGSCLALQQALNALGKHAEVVCQDKVPDNLQFLKGATTVRHPEELSGNRIDLFFAVDVSDQGRLGCCETLMAAAADSVQIDHHGTNPGYARVNVIDPKASATALLAYELIQRLGAPVNVEIAKCLYTGISTDTGNFSFNNTTARAFRVMGELRSLPLPLAEMNRVLFRERSKAQTLLLARALDSLAFSANDRVAGMTLTQDDFTACGALPEHADTLVNFGLDVKGVCMSLLARENGDGGVKASLRGIPGYAVDDIAQQFGGGGHDLAAGCTIDASVAEASRMIRTAMEKKLAAREQAKPTEKK